MVEVGGPVLAADLGPGVLGPAFLLLLVIFRSLLAWYDADRCDWRPGLSWVHLPRSPVGVPVRRAKVRYAGRRCGMRETGRGALLRFVAELTRLRQLAGAPSLNNLVAVAARSGKPLARTTLSDKLNAKSLPDWEFVLAYVHACLGYAEQVGARVPAELTDLSRWDAAHWRLLRAVDSTRAADRLGVAAYTEIGRHTARVDPSGG
ncbi:hypothetical protein R6Y94_34680, partial [Plantactinospora sp. KLBMP9567]|nr:hypothetical protein [Plantactinospora sp. KLBMP9567]